MAKLSRQDLIEDDAIRSIITDLNKLEEQLNRIIKLQQTEIKSNYGQTAQELADLNRQIAMAESTLKQKNKVQQEEQKLTQQLNKSTDEEVRGKLRLQEATKEQRDSIRQLIREEKAQEGSIKSLRLANKRLRKERDQITTSTEEGRKAIQRINAEIDRNNAQVKENSDSMTQQKMNVGNYSDSIQDAIGSTGLFSREIAVLNAIQQSSSKILGILNKQTKANAVASKTAGASAKSMAVGTRISNVALKGLRATLVSLGIGVILIALGALVELFTQFQPVLDFTNKLFTALQGAIGAVVRSFGKLLSGDFKGFFTDVADGATDAWEAVERQVKAQRELEKQQQRTAKENARLNNQIKLNQRVARDTTRSDEDRRDAIEAINQATEQLLVNEKERIALEIEDLKAQAAQINNLDEREKKLTEVANKEAELIKIEGDLIVERDKAGKRQRELDREIEKRKEKQAKEEEKRLKESQKRWEDYTKRLEDIRISSIEDEGKRRIEQIRINANRELEEIIGNTIRAQELREAIIQQRDDKIAEIQAEIQSEKNKQLLDDELEMLKRRKNLYELKGQETLFVEQDIFEKQRELAKKELLKRYSEESRIVQEFEAETTELRRKMQADRDEQLNKEALERLKQNQELVRLEIQNEIDELGEMQIDKKRELEQELKEIEIQQVKDRLAEELQLVGDNETKKNLLREKARKEINAIEKRNITEVAQENQDAIVESFQELSQNVQQVLGELSNERKRQLEFQTKQVDQNVKTQQELAARGLDNQLAHTKQRQAELELERRREAEREERRQKALAYWALFTEFAKEEPNTAAGKALVQTAIAETIAGAFYDGTESLGDNDGAKPFASGRDGYLIRAHRGERIVPDYINKSLGGIKNEDLPDAINAYRNGSFMPFGFDSGSDKVVNELKKTQNEIRKSRIQVDWNSLDQRIERKIEGNVKKAIKHSLTKRRI